VIVDAHAHIIVRAAAAGSSGPAGSVDSAGSDSWRPRVVEEAGRSRIYTDGRELTSIVREFTDPGRMAEEAAAQGVGHLLLSPWVRLLPFGRPLPEARQICKIQNDALSDLVAADPGRFSALGAVALQDPVIAARDLRTLRAAGLAGVELTPEIAGRYLGDDVFGPFWEAAEDTGAVIFIHPATRGLALPVFGDYYLWNSLANPVETAIAAAHLVMAGVLERHPALKILLAHAGGALWAVRGRLRRAHVQVPAARARLRESPDASLALLYHDTVTHDQALLRRLIEDAGSEHVLLGSDRPFDMGSDDPVGEVRGLGLPGAAEAAVLGGNALRLLGLAGAV